MKVAKSPAEVFDMILSKLALYCEIALSSLNTFIVMRAKVDPVFQNPSAILLK